MFNSDNIAAYTIRHNQKPGMEVSHLVIGRERVDKFYEEYCNLPLEERNFTRFDIFMFGDLEDAVRCHEDSVVAEKKFNIPFEGYYMSDRNGNRSHTWDFEESIGE